ncbi:formate dehydrogenase accessory sulfurtransferase FdhD [Mucilaginibacter robiniae]|uniref:Sulfur carrier protein FdhD n=1 Tax=Mucilaginibacter robiniae TaxID=2728022 RepID=A0A7L5E729_9SPHI|nr:formate dehydrogenase accessory sulfurtransferase FdhD [Mucilaginibacter robiniae]QJD98197.1 formate dehydrogenase accessory sulfurtransferase FdhD [Mucilaginibacter robiniae]
MVIDASAIVPVVKIQEGLVEATAEDAVAAEEPLEIRLLFGPENNRQIQNVAVTMRTPGHDADLATGFLFTEGIIKAHSDVAEAGHSFIACAENRENTIQVNLQSHIIPNLRNADRNFYTTSSCGVCGKSSINAIRTVSAYDESITDDVVLQSALLYQLPDLLRQHQQVFESTGGLHASALFSLQGELLAVREDVGRHNALDKLIGISLRNGWLPLHNKVLLLSGRISFELVQKAAMAGIKIVAAIGAPSSLAIQLAQEFNITLVGFLRHQRFNIYTAAHRISTV